MEQPHRHRAVIDTSENKDGIINYLDGCPGLPMQKSGLGIKGKAREKFKRENSNLVTLNSRKFKSLQPNKESRAVAIFCSTTPRNLVVYPYHAE